MNTYVVNLKSRAITQTIQAAQMVFDSKTKTVKFFGPTPETVEGCMPSLFGELIAVFNLSPDSYVIKTS